MTDPDLGARALAGLALIAAGSALAPVAALWLRRIWPERTVFFARWGFFPLVQSAVLMAVLVWLARIALPVSLERTAVATTHFAELLVWAAGLAWAARVILRLHPESWGALGLRRAGSARAAGAGVVLYLLVAPAVLGAGLMGPWLVERLGGTPIGLGEVVTNLDSLRVVEYALIVALLPAAEELFFRGFVQPLFVQNFGEPGGIAACSLAFALMHGPSAAPGAFVLSLAAGYAMLRTQRISAPIAVHALHNAVVIAIVLCAPGGRDLV